MAVLDVQNWEPRGHLEVRNSSFVTLSFSPDGRSLVTGDDEGRVRLWSVEPLREIGLIGRHAARIKSVAFLLMADPLRPRATIGPSHSGLSRGGDW